MVDIGTQTLLSDEILSENQSLFGNDACLLSIMNRTKLECLNHHSQEKNIIHDDPAIVSLGRSNQWYHNKSEIRDDDQQRINVVDQMIAQPHIPYDVLPKHFQPKLFSVKQNADTFHPSMHIDHNRKYSHQKNYLIYNQSYEQYRHNSDINSRLGHRQTHGGSIRANHRNSTFRKQTRITAEHMGKK